MELASDLLDSEGRLVREVGAPEEALEAAAVEVESRGETGSSRGAKEGRLARSSVDDFLIDDFNGCG